VCKNEVILVKVTTVDRVDTLKIFLGDKGTEKEISTMLQEQMRDQKDLPLEDLNDDKEQLDDTDVKIEEIKPRIWTSLGSEAEIILSHAPNQRPLVNKMFFMPRQLFIFNLQIVAVHHRG
jgi:hypothetical protein